MIETRNFKCIDGVHPIKRKVLDYIKFYKKYKN